MNPQVILEKVLARKDLTTGESSQFVSALMSSTVSEVQATAIIIALRCKGETPNEIVGFIQAMRARMNHVRLPGATDIVGTGGDGSGTFNISTASALVMAGAGVHVAKHGNRAASSHCGSADVLEALGVFIELLPDEAERVYAENKLVFLFAPQFHPALKPVAQLRKALKIRTIFNILGPFVNPALTKRQVIGVPTSAHIESLSPVAQRLGYTRALLVSSEDGFDEISTRAKTHGAIIEHKKTRRITIDPEQLGFRKSPRSSLLGGDAKRNAQIINDILNGAPSPARDIVILNAAAGIYTAGHSRTIAAGIALAIRSIDEGHARNALEKLIVSSNIFKKI